MIRVPEKYGSCNPQRIKDIDVVNVDIVPTLREFCGLPAKKTYGISLVPLFDGSKKYKGRNFVIGQYYGKQKWVTPIRMIRTHDYKLNKYIGYKYELYDLKNDPYELINLIDNPKYTEIKKLLSEELDKWIKNNNDPFYSQKATDRSGKILSDGIHP
jgi:choline-sulfatase